MTTEPQQITPRETRFEIGATVRQSKLGEGIVIFTHVENDVQTVGVALPSGDTFRCPAGDLKLVKQGPAVAEPVKVNDLHRGSQASTLRATRRAAVATTAAKKGQHKPSTKRAPAASKGGTA